MIISTCGFGSTGSSAVCDYLMECEDVVNFDAIEFTISTMVDGLEDLEYHLMTKHTRLSSGIYAIQRFRKAIQDRVKEWSVATGAKKIDILRLTDEYLDSITQLKFIGFSPMLDKRHSELLRHYLGESIILHRLIPFLEKKKYIKENFDYYPLDTVSASIKPTNFYEASKKYVDRLLKLFGCDTSKHIVLDQAFVGNDPLKSIPFFENPYAIVIDRDPRDLFIFAKKVLLSRGRFMPTDTVENFVTYYRMMRDNQPYKIAHERLLSISFESMVYDYETTSQKIDSFLGVKNIARQSIFKPSMSAANTNLIRRFPEFRTEVEYIESHLQEYLFPFDNYKGVFSDVFGTMFFGKSPLNKQ